MDDNVVEPRHGYCIEERRPPQNEVRSEKAITPQGIRDVFTTVAAPLRGGCRTVVCLAGRTNELHG